MMVDSPCALGAHTKFFQSRRGDLWSSVSKRVVVGADPYRGSVEIRALVLHKKSAASQLRFLHC